MAEREGQQLHSIHHVCIAQRVITVRCATCHIQCVLVLAHGLESLVCKAQFQGAASPCSRWPIASFTLLILQTSNEPRSFAPGYSVYFGPYISTTLLRGSLFFLLNINFLQTQIISDITVQQVGN